MKKRNKKIPYRTGFNPNKSGYFYLFKIGDYIKYGITNNQPEVRMAQHARDYIRSVLGIPELIYTKKFECGFELVKLENKIKRMDVFWGTTSQAKEDGWRFSGYTETVSDDFYNRWMLINTIHNF